MRFTVSILVAVFSLAPAVFAADTPVAGTSIASDAAVATHRRRRAVRVPSPPPFQLKATVGYSPAEGALSRVFGPLPVGTTIELQVERPDGSIALSRVSWLELAPVPEGFAFISTNAVGSPWNGPLPPDWPSGVTKFRTIVVRERVRYTFVQNVAKGISAAQLAELGPLGPLYAAKEDVLGGVILEGLFFAAPFVVSQYRIGMLALQGSNYIPPGEVSPLPAEITACSPTISGVTTDFWCSSVISSK